ncbi:Carbon-nitrogen hydrolase family protein [Rhodovastum atsumiense]|uniref:Carbon-nitrogen hydrolase family protein n=1 Tax=Rhodovastum atsumiense TaxID=504468 RepID=A0A5M6INY4_9PROT|nr:carbon-nitrogen hydrolase family protein [Rhodovastum atsumiense]KAA5609983.1 carbon-nitrogen hydrolase family protein [Rhodovastum atsumiense]CAH2598624.1 Carbon-nitrogen hydrolase family protein [Rhodovastum atsumiense]
MSELRLGLLQYPVEPLASFEAFAAKLDRLIAEGARGAELLVMPEYACMEVAAPLGAPTDPAAELDAVCARAADVLQVMRAAARRHQVWLLPGSLPWREQGRVRNRAPLIAPDGRVAFQDKRVMTRFEAEAWGVGAGDPPAVFETPWGRIGIAICYDLEFPSLVRAQVEAGAWLILAPTCTDTLHGFNRVRLSARARALENQCFVAIAPTVGVAPHLATLDVNRGFAAVYGPVDRGFPEDGVIIEGEPDAGQFVFATLDPARLEAVRTDGGVRNHRDWPAPPPPCPLLTPREMP